jgi:hypothetical protein
MASATRAARPVDPAPAHAEPIATVWERTGSRLEGLTPEEVARRPAPAAARPEQSQAAAVVEEIVESVAEPLMLLLILVGVLSAIFGELRDAIAIFIVIVLIGAVASRG